MSEELTIQDLCDQTGIPRRTIHFYTQQGILPPPQGSGLGTRYLPEHLLRLQLIPVFRKMGLRLDDIRRKFHSMSIAEMKDAYSLNQTTVPEIIPLHTVPSPLHINLQTFTAYTLPQGMILMVPVNPNADLKTQLQKILQVVQMDKK